MGLDSPDECAILESGLRGWSFASFVY